MKIVFAITLLLAIAMGSAQAGLSLDLEEYRWKNRLLIIFAPSKTDQTYLKLQHALDRAEDALQGRDMLVFHLFASGSGWVGDIPVHAEAVRSFYRRFDVQDQDLNLILIGKDGGEKVRQVGSFDLQDIFDRIDAMPMRQQEMRERREIKNGGAAD
ncbi:DUF4174 domain-containing protein [Desulfohalobium retbaense]|uniref:DUF4174 domain-containing protein n=1 Tax=Desulfohalobium retbaense (strain ATCC 49708 / DSM 5692 / JCM 16813 / HR100) TaxID=485915 RepID=C8X1D1_DESRD|nr:DUF4174 domain-containing protein [Desulfohalobium retbaense]ACV68228.1 conserved hypothetical protein [Desulfohalobium retbaense DSM 5692]